MNARIGLLFLTLSASACGDDGAATDASADAVVDDGAVDATTGPPTFAFEAIDPPPAEGPLGFWGFMAARLDESRTLVFGGATFSSMGGGGSVLEEAYLYDASGGALELTEIAPADNPGPRYCGCAAWDPAREVVVFVGGRDRAGEEYAPETWELDVDTSTWTLIGVPSTPSGVVGCAMAHASGSMYLFGGRLGDEGGSFSDETFRYDPATPSWELLDTPGPQARYDAVIAPLTPEGPIVLYAGSLGPEGAAFFNDIWLFDPASETWTEEMVVGDPGPARRAAWMPWANSDGFVVGFGNQGLDVDQVSGDLAYYDFGTHTWTDITPADGPGPRSFTQPLAGGPDAVAYMLGGYDNVGPVLELWRLVER